LARAERIAAPYEDPAHEKPDDNAGQIDRPSDAISLFVSSPATKLSPSDLMLATSAKAAFSASGWMF
jgi:hypothetical protein